MVLWLFLAAAVAKKENRHMKQTNGALRYLLLDTETGGKDPSKGSLLSLHASLLNHELDTIRSIDLLLKPNQGDYYCIEPEAMATNRIDLTKHDKLAMTYERGAVQLSNFLSWHEVSYAGFPIALGHNVHFDIEAISGQLLPDFKHRLSHRHMDTASIVILFKQAGIIPQTVTNLQSVAEHFSIATSPEELHTAKGDAQLTLNIYKKMCSILSELPSFQSNMHSSHSFLNHNSL